MINLKLRRISRIIFLTAIILLITAGLSSAVTYTLRADIVPKTMPDGITVITMWGFSCEAVDVGTCPNQGVVTIPGPQLVVPVGDNTLTINLTNNLPEPVSIVINGQMQSPSMVPVWTDGSSGPRTDVAQRVRSFTHETASGATNSYTWNNFKPGTYLYQSGTHPSVQVQMGLYGAVKKDAAAGEAYTGILYNNEATLVFSEIDPALHAAVAGGTYGTPAYPSTMDYRPKYFLVNGEAYSASSLPIFAGNTFEAILIRFLNAGINDLVPIIHGIYLEVVAEDGNLMPYSKEQYTMFLPAGKTMDALISPVQPGTVPVYDRRLHLTNAAVSPGGMLAYLIFLPSATQIPLLVNKTGTGSGTIGTVTVPPSAGIGCGPNCTAYPVNTAVILTPTPGPTSIFSGWTGCDSVVGNDCNVTMTTVKSVTATFISNNIVIAFPNGGENLRPGAAYAISWTYPGNPGPSVKIDLMRNGAFYSTIIGSTPTGNLGSGSYNWTIPSRIILGGGYQIRVTSTSNGAFTDMSDSTFGISLTGCTYTLTPNGANYTSAGGGGSFNVTTQTGCGWTATTADAWITITPPNAGTGTGPVNYTVTANTGPARTGAIAAGGQTFTITQTGCTYTLAAVAPNPADFAIGGGAGSFTVTTQAGCNWTATTADAWITNILPASGTGPGPTSVNYDVGANAGAPRAGAIAVGGQNFGITQQGTTPTITVALPNGGENIKAGTTYQITWTYTSDPGALVRIELLRNGILSSTITTGTSIGVGGNGSFNWTLPLRMMYGGGYSIRITSTTNGAYTDMSNATFNIIQ